MTFIFLTQIVSLVTYVGTAFFLYRALVAQKGINWKQRRLSHLTCSPNPSTKVVGVYKMNCGECGTINLSKRHRVPQTSSRLRQQKPEFSSWRRRCEVRMRVIKL
jgi:hypothetical protein